MKKLVGLLVLVAGVASAAIPQSERDVLIGLYNSTNGDSWTTKSNWKSAGIFSAAGTECSWYGITCTGDAVTAFNLPANNLTGSIPSLTGLTNLQFFAVPNNQLTGSIPSLTGLANLQEFEVEFNQLTGSIPALTGLTSLRSFVVQYNQLTGSIPSLSGLTNLLFFYVGKNQLTGSIPALTGLTNLQTFYVENNQLTGSIPALTGLANLWAFDVDNNQLTGHIPALTGLTSLAIFAAVNNQLTGAIPALTGLTNLWFLRVHYNYLTGPMPDPPSPSALFAGNSQLCPNYLTQSVSAAWDAAESSRPHWYSSCLVPGVPTAPTIGTASAGNTRMSVTFTAPVFTGASAITSYTATCGSVTATGTTSPITVTGLINGTAYTCTVAATNAFGSGVYSSASNSVTPMAALIITSLSSMGISVVPNQSLLGTGTVTVVANQSGTWTATSATPWLSLTQSSGGFPGVVAATASAAGLAAGSYNGSISVAGTAVGGAQTITIPVTLTVNSPAALTASPTSIFMASSYPAGSATGYTIQTGEPGLAFTALTSASSAGWLTVGPASGIAPTPIIVTLDPSKATPGTYTDSIVVSSGGVASVTVPVKMAVSGFMATLPQQVNAATQAGPDHTVAPNELVTLYLTDFSCATAPVVSINGTAVSWSSYVPGQLNYAVPANITQPAALTVACNGTTAWSFNGLTTAAVVPGIFTRTGTGNGQAAIVNSDGTLNGSTKLATRGSWLSIYGTGFGVFNAAAANGLRTLAGTVTATIGGIEAKVLYAGEAPGSPDALQQFNLQIPVGAPAGTAVPIVLTVNGTPTQKTATVSLQ